MNRIPLPISLILLASLAGCAVGPDYRRPEMAAPAAYKEEGANWKSAEPRDAAPRGNWWESFGDPRLNELEQQVERSNQNVRAAEAQFRQAQAVLGATRAGYFPNLGAGVSNSRGRSVSGTNSDGTTSTGSGVRETDRLSLSASWEADVWGRIRRSVESGEASAQASAADLGAALLSAQATLAQSYLQLRALDVQRSLLARTVAAYARSLQITDNRYRAGVAGRTDVVQAEAQLQSTRAQALDLDIQRAQLEHAIALLLGKTPADFRLEDVQTVPAPPGIPVGIPSQLLERRPDVAAAERRAAAANAQIGVAQAAFFPTLTLNASGGYQNSTFAQLLSAPNRFWSLGPTLALTLFDTGARAAQKEQALAGYDKSVANYRQTVLTAFQEVEDNLVALRVLAEEEQVQRAAAKAAAEALLLTENQYQAGTVSYLNVVAAQATSLSAERGSLDIASRRLVASVGLLRALGGGWRLDAGSGW